MLQHVNVLQLLTLNHLTIRLRDQFLSKEAACEVHTLSHCCHEGCIASLGIPQR